MASQKDLMDAFFKLLELVKNDERGSQVAWPHHFCEVVGALVDKETKSWRDAYNEMVKSVGILGAENQKLEAKLNKSRLPRREEGK